MTPFFKNLKFLNPPLLSRTGRKDEQMEKRINFLVLVVFAVLAVFMASFSGCAGVARVSRLEKQFSTFEADIKTNKLDIEDHSEKFKAIEKNQKGLIQFTGFDPDEYDPNTGIYLSIVDKLNVLETAILTNRKNAKKLNSNINYLEKRNQNQEQKIVSLFEKQKKAVTLTELDRAMKASTNLEQITFEMTDKNRIMVRVSFPLGVSELSDYQKKLLTKKLKNYIAPNDLRIIDDYVMTFIKGYYSPRGRTVSLAVARALSVYNFLDENFYAFTASDEVIKLIEETEKSIEAGESTDVLCGGLLRREVVMIFEKESATPVRKPAYISHIDPNSNK
ncbi:hypothetical protein ACFL23_03210 [Patescibacteria group bacterium]